MMSLQWTIIATFLYSEVGVCLLFLLPFISATRWRSLFKSRILDVFTSYANYYFGFFLLMLFICFIDGIREIRRYSGPLSPDDLKINPAAEVNQHMKLFRAQRNFYIAGFSLFLFLILRRLVVLINHQATIQADCEAAKKQAESATAAAKRLMEDQDNKANEVGENKVTAEQLQKAEMEIAKLKDALQHSRADFDVIKKQAESTNREYDRLQKELAKVQDELRHALEGKKPTESKKEE